MVDTLVRYAERIMEVGAEQVLAEADLDKAAREAEKDRRTLLVARGDDANHTAEKIELIKKR
jgi:hypothetical protein